MGFRTESNNHRQRWAGVGVVALLLLLLAGVLLTIHPVAAAGPTYVSGPILTPTTWTAAGSPYIVTGTVTVVPTASLTIEPGVEVRFWWETALIAYGPLTAVGTAAQPITFTTDLDPPVPVAWDGIHLAGSHNTVQHCFVEYGYYGLYIYPTSDDNLVADNRLQLNGHWLGPVGGAILGSTDGSQFLRNVIENSPFGILLIESSDNVIADNTLAFLDDVGISLQGSPSVYGTGNVVTGNRLGHIGGEGLSFVYQLDLTVADNWLYQTAQTPDLAYARLDGPLAGKVAALPEAGGLSVYNSAGVTLHGNRVTESGQGGAPTYRAAVYINNTANLTFDGNLVHLNKGDGLEYAAGNDGMPTLHNNAFWDNQGFQLESFYPAAIDVSGNWWGTNSPLAGVEFSGTLTYAPWVTLALTADPLFVPADGLSRSDLTVTMLDGAGHHAPDGMEVGLETSLGTLSTPLVTTTAGVAVAHLTAPLSPGTAWLTATAPPPLTTTVPPGRQAHAWVSFISPSPLTLTLTADPMVIPADGVSTSTLRAEARDALGNPAGDGTVVVFSTTLGTFPGGLTLTPIPTGTMTVEAEGGDVSKVGTWIAYTDPNASGGGGVYSNGVGDKVTYIFTGTAVSVLFQKQFNAGIAHLYLDGVFYREVDTYAPSVLYQQEEPVAADLTYAPHLVEVVVTGLQNPASSGSYLVVDALRVYGHDRNGAYLTGSGVATVTLTSVITPGIAQVGACAGPACDSTTVRFATTGPQTLTLTANPTVIPAGGVSTSTLRAEVLNGLGDPVADGTEVAFSTTLGSFPGRGIQAAEALTTTALTSGGVATVTLTSAITPGTALVTACAGPACDSTTVRFRVPGMTNFYLPIIMKNYTPPPRPVCQERIENGGFETDDAWVISATPRPARYTNERAHNGSRSMLLGIKPGEPDVRSYSSVRQTISLPATTYTATLTFWYYPLSGLDPGDRQECLLLDEDDHLLAILMRTNVNTAAWTQMTFDLSAYAGRTVQVYFNAYNDADGSGVAAFYLDDVSVQACTLVGGPTPTPTPIPSPTPPGPTPTPTPGPPGCYPVQVTTVAAGDMPHGVAVNRDAKRLYVANYGADTLSVFDTTTYAPVTTVNVGDGPNGVAYNPANGLIYVANRNANTVSVLRSSDYGLVKTIAVGAQPNGLGVNEATNRVYVANFGSDTVSIINGATNTVIKTVAVGDEPSMVAVNPLSNKAYVSLHGAAGVAVIDGAGDVKTVSLFDSAGPYGIAVDTLRNLVYVATIDTFRVVVLDGNTDIFLGWAEIRRLPGAEPVPLRMVAVNPLIGTSGHIFLTTIGEDGGWNKFLLLPKGWLEYFARAHALDLNEAREGMAFEPTTLRLFVPSRADDLVAVYLDGEPVCPNNFATDYQITICVAGPGGSCWQIFTR